VNRDHLMFTAIGLLAGFIAGYVMHEVMAARQPPLRTVSLGAAARPEATGQPFPGAAPPPAAASGAPAMEEVNRLNAALQQNPNDADALLRLANLYFDISSWQRAKELYERLLALRPESPDVWTDLGVCERELGQYERALEHFRKAQQMAPEHWQAVYNEVVVLAFDLQQLDAAAERAAKLGTMQPGNPDVGRLVAEIERRRSAA
jgi:Flp pilus assembly protein TadD